MAPNAAQNPRPARMAAHHGQFVVSGCTSCTVMAAPHAPTKPTERSISPRTKAKPSAIARTMITALCWKRFTRLTAERKTWFGLMVQNTTTIAIIATMTGRTPLSPALMRDAHARTYSPSDWATSAGGTSATTSGTAVRSSLSPVLVTSASLDVSAIAAAHASRCHVLHHALPVELGCVVLDDQTAQVHDGDSIGDLEDVIQVVRDEHHSEAAVAQPLGQVQHLLGLHDAEGGGRLVHDHELGVPHHGFGHRDRLPLAARQRGDRLPDRSDGCHAQSSQRLGRGALHAVLVEEAVARLFATEKHVLHDVEVVRQREVLVDGLDTEARRVARAADVRLLAFPDELAMVDLIDARDAFGKHGFARPVIANERRHLSGRKVQVDVIQGLDWTAVLVQPPHLQQRLLSRSRLGDGGRHFNRIISEKEKRRREVRRRRSLTVTRCPPRCRRPLRPCCRARPCRRTGL